MLSCIKGQPCDPEAKKPANSCGSNIAYAYFVSFIFFCSFLVSPPQKKNLHDLLLSLPLDVESVRRRHHGQLRLLNPRLFHPGGPSPGRVRPDLGRVRPERYVIQTCHTNFPNNSIGTISAGKYTTWRCTTC